MQMLGDDDMNLKDMTLEELERAWDLWFDLAQHTNEFDPPYTHGVFQTVPFDAGHGGAQKPPGHAAGPAPDQGSRR